MAPADSHRTGSDGIDDTHMGGTISNRGNNAASSFIAKESAADGKSVTATLGQGSLTLPATRIPSASCHGPDGLGRPDAGVVPSDITWANLSKAIWIAPQQRTITSALCG